MRVPIVSLPAGGKSTVDDTVPVQMPVIVVKDNVRGTSARAEPSEGVNISRVPTASVPPAGRVTIMGVVPVHGIVAPVNGPVKGPKPSDVGVKMI